MESHSGRERRGDEPGPGGAGWTVDLPDLAATARLAALIAGELRPGDLVTLSGALGSGKTAFARALIRAIADDPALEVPSPTYTLLQTYETARMAIVHADLYRIADPSELEQIGWDEAAETALVVVEWPERVPGALAETRVDITLSLDPRDPERRRARVHAHGPVADRLEVARAVAGVLAEAGMVGATRSHMQGDASTRSFERLSAAGEAGPQSAILMISPPRPDGPAIRFGKSYSALAKLAESVHAFVAMARGLGERGFSAPRILAQDLDLGFLVVEDLGSEGVTGPDGPIEERYGEAVSLLARLHAMHLPQELPVAPGVQHRIPRYDLEAMLIEVELMIEWYLPWRGQHALSASQRLAFVDRWTQAVEPVLNGETSWTLRDFHSPNLLWLPEREGIRRIGLIDFQDCLIGHPAYDLVSLLQDARVDVPEEMELRLLSHYARTRIGNEPGFSMPAFAGCYAILGAQRATKILGIFARLAKRDGKPQYLRHLPRIERHLVRCLAHPVLSDLKLWYEANLPELGAPA